MKTIGVLFDVSGSMKKKFNNIKDIDNKDINKVNKKSDELINILKNQQKILMQKFSQYYLGFKIRLI